MAGNWFGLVLLTSFAAIYLAVPIDKDDGEIWRSNIRTEEEDEVGVVSTRFQDNDETMMKGGHELHCHGTLEVKENSRYCFGSATNVIDCAFFGADGYVPAISCHNVSKIQSEDCDTNHIRISDGVGHPQRICKKTEKLTTRTSIMFVKSHIPFPEEEFHFHCCVTAVEGNCLSESGTPSVEPKRRFADCVSGKTRHIGRIVGGHDAARGNYPWQVAIKQTEGHHIAYCGGTLINDRSVITAAHCCVLSGIYHDSTKAEIVFNAWNIYSRDEGEQSFTRSIEEVKVHSLYNRTSQVYDVCIISLKIPIDLEAFFGPEAHVAPIRLPCSDTCDKYEGEMGTVTGWGTISSGGKQSEILQEVELPIWDQPDCQEAYAPHNIALQESMICAGYDEGGKDACQGDSGGGFVVHRDGAYYLAGVVSFGIGCGEPGIPGIYVRVTAICDWIYFLTWKNSIWCADS